MNFIEFPYDIINRDLCEDGVHTVMVERKQTVIVHEGILEVWVDQVLRYCPMKGLFIRYNGIEYGKKDLTLAEWLGVTPQPSGEQIFDIEFDFEFE